MAHVLTNRLANPVRRLLRTPLGVGLPAQPSEPALAAAAARTTLVRLTDL
jgi:hypothetical protein